MLNCQNIFPKVLLDLGNFQIHTYGVLATLGVIFGYFIIKYLTKRDNKIKKEEIFDYIFWALIGGIIGSRIFYVLIYNFDYFTANPEKIFAIWQGGISVHGGIIGGTLSLWIYTKIKKQKFLYITDLIVIGFVFALCLGRIGNFVNGELIGRETEFFMGCDFGDGVARWPSQLIDSFKNLTIFFILFYIYLKIKPKIGFISSLFLILIGSFRFLTEFIREPDSQLGFIISFLTMGQILAILTIFFGIIVFYFSKKHYK